ncbi:hypothetical protein F5Y15DRAFT_385543 [Xylariaceae sp. FL0016]|nr:hypothetical protein F5Y15DRAFT_385543 [Xylariaceae sp. FL0016]
MKMPADVPVSLREPSSLTGSWQTLLLLLHKLGGLAAILQPQHGLQGSQVVLDCLSRPSSPDHILDKAVYMYIYISLSLFPLSHITIPASLG